MPIRPPALDDRSFDDLVADLVRRIPAHTPEWTQVGEGDPGRTLIDLFAWLGDTILYRANLIPERQRLAFLRLLGAGMRPAIAAQGMIQLAIAEPAVIAPLTLPLYSAVDKPLPFETLSEVMVHAVEGRAFIKRTPTVAEDAKLRDVLPSLGELYGVSGTPRGYVTTPVFTGAVAGDVVDVVAGTRDHCLWIALLAATPDPAQVAAIRDELGGGADNRRRAISIGVAPAIAVPEAFGDVGVRARVPHVWEICTGAGKGDVYIPLQPLADGSAGLTRAGVVRLLMPGKDDIGAPSNDVVAQPLAGSGNLPPRIDDPIVAARLVTWLRLRPDPRAHLTTLKLGWAGVNAVAIEQRRTLGRQTIGQGSGASDLELSLGTGSVEASTLAIEVEEEEGMRPWRLVPDTAAARRDDRVFSLDGEAGMVRFGDGVRGMVPARGRQIAVARMRAGGGAAGNLPAGSIKAIAAPPGSPRLKVTQPLAMSGGSDAEALAAAERRIPALIRNGNRAVTATDYKEQALRTPGVAVGRAEVLERFKPQQRRDGVPGVVTVMVLPQREGTAAPAPRADRPLLESVHAWLDERRPLATELYVVGTDYVPVGVSAAVELVDTTQREAVLDAVSEAIRLHLWPLAPGGPDGLGWPLGRGVDDRLIEAAIGRVPGVRTVAPVRLFKRKPGGKSWLAVAEDANLRGGITLQRWQLPELAMLAVSEGGNASPTLPAAGFGDAGGPDGVSIPVVPEFC